MILHQHHGSGLTVGFFRPLVLRLREESNEKKNRCGGDEREAVSDYVVAALMTRKQQGIGGGRTRRGVGTVEERGTSSPTQASKVGQESLCPVVREVLTEINKYIYPKFTKIILYIYLWNELIGFEYNEIYRS